MNILFITSNRLGDTVLSTGLLGHLIAQHPGARITVVCGPVPAPLFAATPNVVHVISFAKRRWSLHWLGLWLATVGTVWDSCSICAVRRLVIVCWHVGAAACPEPMHRSTRWCGWQKCWT